MTSPTQVPSVETATPGPGEVSLSKDSAGKGGEQSLSPGQLMWKRFKRDRTGVISAFVVIFFFLIAALAPVISMLYGKDPYTLYGQRVDPTLLDSFGYPSGPNGGISSEFWFGVEPVLGRDVFTQLLYGMRTSLYTALACTIPMVLMGIVIGLIGGYFGGKVDYWVGRVTDFMMALPSQLTLIAVMPVVVALFVPPTKETPVYIQFCAIVVVLWLLGWMGMARLVRSSALTLREREFVEAAKVSGASPWRIIRKELLPNLMTPILVQATYMLPAAILTVAFLSYIGVGYVEPTPDWGRMFSRAADIYQYDPTYMFFPGIAMVIFVVAFNLLGDSVRDAFDPKSGR